MNKIKNLLIKGLALIFVIATIIAMVIVAIFAISIFGLTLFSFALLSVVIYVPIYVVRVIKKSEDKWENWKTHLIMICLIMLSLLFFNF
jgi:hypothetical protein